jgi:ATP phosphoribosyltransferase regulatory subunit HisZ
MRGAEVISAGIAPDARAEALVASFERGGYARVAPALLQPAEPFLDLSGEDIRRRMYLTVDPQGRELCLRPDLTIPVSRHYLASPAAGTLRTVKSPLDRITPLLVKESVPKHPSPG